MTSEITTAGSPSLRMDTGIGPIMGVGPRSASWRTRLGPMSLDRPRIMGILNLTPDSFWPESRIPDTDHALRRAARMIAAGADLIDVGGESTRPGAEPVSEADEVARVVPVVRAIAREWPDTPISVDTVKAGVAAAALEAGAAVVNDVSALRIDPRVAEAVASAGAGLVLMHSRGDVDRMASYELATYGVDPVGEVASELDAAVRNARSAGIPADAIVLDPGLGFSKRTEHSLAVLRGVGRILARGFPVLVGPSRKRFVGDLGGGAPPEERLPATIAACVTALAAGVRLFRVHDVAETRSALDLAEAVLR